MRLVQDLLQTWQLPLHTRRKRETPHKHLKAIRPVEGDMDKINVVEAEAPTITEVVEAPKITEVVEASKITEATVETTEEAVEISGMIVDVRSPNLKINQMTAVGLDLATKVQLVTDVASQTTMPTTLSAGPSMQNADIATR